MLKASDSVILLGIPKWEAQMQLEERNALKWEELNIASTFLKV